MTFVMLAILGTSVFETKDRFVNQLLFVILAVSLLTSGLVYIIKSSKLLK